MGLDIQNRPASSAVSDGERNLLRDYLDDIRDLAPLAPDEQIHLLESMGAAETRLREAMAQIPEVSRVLIRKWTHRRENGLVSGALSKWHRDGSQRDLNVLIDTAFGKIESALAAIPLTGCVDSADPLAGRAALAQKVVEAEVSLPILLEILEGLSKGGSDPMSRNDRRFLGEAIEARAHLSDSKNRFIRHNLRLVIRCANRFRNQGVAFLDLIQEGNIGLIRAVEKFDHRRGYKFSTYAVWWIEQSLIRAIAIQSRTVRIPSPLLDQRRKLKQLEGSMRARSAGEPTPLELLDELGTSEADVDDLRRTLAVEVSTQAFVGGTDHVTVEDTLTQPPGRDFSDGFDAGVLGNRLRQIIPSLDRREQRVIEARFGLLDDVPRTLQDIGRELGVSRSRVRQIEQGALEQLKNHRLVQSIAAEMGCL